MNELLTGEDRDVLSFFQSIDRMVEKSGVYPGIAAQY